MLVSATVSAGFSNQFVRRIGNEVLEYTEVGSIFWSTYIIALSDRDNLNSISSDIEYQFNRHLFMSTTLNITSSSFQIVSSKNYTEKLGWKNWRATAKFTYQLGVFGNPMKHPFECHTAS